MYVTGRLLSSDGTLCDEAWVAVETGTVTGVGEGSVPSDADSVVTADLLLPGFVGYHSGPVDSAAAERLLAAGVTHVVGPTDGCDGIVSVRPKSPPQLLRSRELVGATGPDRSVYDGPTVVDLAAGTPTSVVRETTVTDGCGFSDEETTVPEFLYGVMVGRAVAGVPGVASGSPAALVAAQTDLPPTAPPHDATGYAVYGLTEAEVTAVVTPTGVYRPRGEAA
ncbi:MAG: hypothetical protein ABEI99_03550 [Halobaculum sp.]